MPTAPKKLKNWLYRQNGYRSATIRPIAWGLFQGSGKAPYQIKLNTLKLQNNDRVAIHCTCPSHKQPCKHGLALAFILVQKSDAVPESAPPEFVTIWLEKVANQARQQQGKKKKTNRKPLPIACAPDVKPVCSPGAARHLLLMLNVGQHIEAFLEWLREITKAGQRVTEELLPLLLITAANSIIYAKQSGQYWVIADSGWAIKPRIGLGVEMSHAWLTNGIPGRMRHR